MKLTDSSIHETFLNLAKKKKQKLHVVTEHAPCWFLSSFFLTQRTETASLQWTFQLTIVSFDANFFWGHIGSLAKTIQIHHDLAKTEVHTSKDFIASNLQWGGWQWFCPAATLFWVHPVWQGCKTNGDVVCGVDTCSIGDLVLSNGAQTMQVTIVVTCQRKTPSRRTTIWTTELEMCLFQFAMIVNGLGLICLAMHMPFLHIWNSVWLLCNSINQMWNSGIVVQLSEFDVELWSTSAQLFLNVVQLPITAWPAVNLKGPTCHSYEMLFCLCVCVNEDGVLSVQTGS